MASDQTPELAAYVSDPVAVKKFRHAWGFPHYCGSALRPMKCGLCALELAIALLDARDREIKQEKNERQRLHGLVAHARNYIDPEEHEEWEQGAYLEASQCEQRIERLEAENATLRATLEAVRVFADQYREAVPTWRLHSALEGATK